MPEKQYISKVNIESENYYFKDEDAREMMPSKVSDLTNDSGYQTESQVNTLIGTAIGGINQFNVAVVQALPTTDIDAHTIYFVPQQNAQTANTYEEWMYINSQWELIGTTAIDLTGYATESYVDTAVSSVSPLRIVYTFGETGLSCSQNYSTILSWVGNQKPINAYYVTSTGAKYTLLLKKSYSQSDELSFMAISTDKSLTTITHKVNNEITITTTNLATESYVDSATESLAEKFIVSISGTSPYTADKTYEEIIEALSNGYNVLLKTENNNYYPYQSYDTSYSDRYKAINFYNVEYFPYGNKISIQGYFITSADSVGIINEEVSIPSSLSQLENDAGYITSSEVPSEADNIYSLNLSSYTRQQLSQGIVDSADASVISEIDSNYEEGVTKVKFSFIDGAGTPDIVATSAGPKFSITLDGNTFNNVMKFTFAGVYLESASEMLSPPSFVASIYIVPNANMIMIIGTDIAENFDHFDGEIGSLETSIRDLDDSLATVAKTGDYSDLQNTPDLSGFVDSSSLATIATTGDYEDLTNAPTNLSEFTNDVDFVESSQLGAVAFSDDYNDLVNQPTALSNFTNDVNYLAIADVAAVAMSGDYTDLVNAPDVPQSGDYVKTIFIRDISIPFESWDDFDSASFKYSVGLQTFPQATIDEIDNFLTDSTTLAVVTRILNSNDAVIQSSVMLNYVNTYTDTDLNLGKTRMFVGVVTDKIGSTQASPRNPHILSLGIGDNGALCSLWTVAEKRDIPEVPTNVSSFTNDAGYITLADLPIYDGTVV